MIIINIHVLNNIVLLHLFDFCSNFVGDSSVYITEQGSRVNPIKTT
jgi:hypothetical protein